MRHDTDHRSSLGCRLCAAACATVLALFVLLALALFILPSSTSTPGARAGTRAYRLSIGSFNGSDSTGGAFTNLLSIAVDYKSGDVYAIDQGKEAICKFDANGAAQDFTYGPSAGKSCLTGTDAGLGEEFTFNRITGIAVDNSAGPDQGHFYVLEGKFNQNGPVYAFRADGKPLWEIEPASFGEGYSEDCAIASGADGGPWVANRAKEYVQHFGAFGNPLETVHLPKGTGTCAIGVDANENIYYGLFDGGGLFKLDRSSKEAMLIDPRPVSEGNSIAVDQSAAAGHVFALHKTDFSELGSGGLEVGTFGVGTIVNGEGTAIAYNPTNDRVYAGDRGSSVVRIFGPLTNYTVPDVTLEPPSAIGATTATFGGTVNPAGLNTSYHFEWKRSSQSWAEAQKSTPQALPADHTDYPVSFDATGLTAATIYNLRLIATNTDVGIDSISNVENFSDIATRAVTRGAAPRTDTTARLNALLDPAGNTTTYRFEYSRDGVEWTALPDRLEDPGGAEMRPVGEELSELQPATTYHIRFYAENALGSVAGGERTFTTRTSAEVEAAKPPPGSCPNEAVRQKQHSTYLLDCRGFELINNPDKGDQNVVVSLFEDLPATPEGDSALWAVSGSAPGANSGNGAHFLAQRSPSGWRSIPLEPPPAEQVGAGIQPYEPKAMTPDLSRFVEEVTPPGGSEGEDSYVRLDRSQHQDLLDSFPEGKESGIDLSEEAAHVVLVKKEARPQLWDIGKPAAPEVLSIMPDGTKSACGLLTGESFRGPFPSMSLFSTISGGAEANNAPGYHMIAATDASRVYFEAKPNKSGGGCESAAPLGLYVRNREGAGKTSLIDPGSGTHEAQFIRTTPDGRAAYFTTYDSCRKWSQAFPFSCESPETADANGHPDVYRWDEEEGPGGESSCLTCGVENEAGEAISDASVGEVLVSDDFSHIYFSSTKMLAPGATAGDKNIYTVSGGAIRFVADPNSPLGPLGFLQRPQLSGDGNVLVFLSVRGRDITADPRSTSCAYEGKPVKCGELYRYDDRDRSLECVSCLRGGVTSAEVTSARMSGDGSTVAFTTKAALVPGDVNHGTDVYEWRNGSQGLLTDGLRDFPESHIGTGAVNPTVRYVDANGSDIMFSLVAPGLTGFEQDGLANFYDARIGGGWQPPTAPAHCTEDSCQGPLQAAPALPQPGSETHSGPGNEGGSKPPCARGKVRRHGHCVRRRDKRRHHKRAAHANQGRNK